MKNSSWVRRMQAAVYHLGQQYGLHIEGAVLFVAAVGLLLYFLHERNILYSVRW